MEVPMSKRKMKTGIYTNFSLFPCHRMLSNNLSVSFQPRTAAISNCNHCAKDREACDRSHGQLKLSETRIHRLRRLLVRPLFFLWPLLSLHSFLFLLTLQICDVLWPVPAI